MKIANIDREILDSSECERLRRCIFRKTTGGSQIDSPPLYFSHIETEDGDLPCKFPYSVQTQENTDQKNSN